MNQGAFRYPYRGLALGVFAGVVLAEALSRHIAPFSAWLIGGSLFGLVPAGCDRPRSWTRLVVTALATAFVAASAHWLATRLLS